MKDKGFGFQYQVHQTSGYAFVLCTLICLYLSWIDDPRLIGMLWTTIVAGYINVLTEKGG